MLPSVILNSYVKSMLGTCPHPLVEGLVALRPPKKGVLIESPLALLDQSYRDRMTSFKVLLELRTKLLYDWEESVCSFRDVFIPYCLPPN